MLNYQLVYRNTIIQDVNRKCLVWLIGSLRVIFVHERGVKGRSDPINLFVMKRKKGYSQSLFTLLVCCVYIFFFKYSFQDNLKKDAYITLAILCNVSQYIMNGIIQINIHCNVVIWILDCHKCTNFWNEVMSWANNSTEIN